MNSKLENSNKIWNIDLEPEIKYEPSINLGFVSSTDSTIHPVNLQNKISSNSLKAHALIESSHHSYPKVIPPRIKHVKITKKESFFKSKILNHPKRVFYLKILLVVAIICFLLGLGFTIFAAIKPCLLTKCHKKASLCINRFPFWAQCVCDEGFAGNGKAYCVECGKSYVSSNLVRVVGGIDSVKSSWPFSAYVIQSYRGRYNIKGESYMISYTWSCGATIINHKTLLTAAHCIHDQNFEYRDSNNNYYTLQLQWNEWYNSLESTIEVYIGIHDLRFLNQTKRIRVAKVNKHEEFDEFNLKNDIATIQLEDLITANYETQFACLPYLASTLYPETDKEAFIIGWGRISEKGPSSNILKNSKIKIYNETKCSNVEIKISKFWNSQICAGVLDGTTDTCQGDSGGGLFNQEDSNNQSRFFVSGVVSYGDGCARVSKPGIYTRTSYFLEWIRKNSDF